MRTFDYDGGWEVWQESTQAADSSRATVCGCHWCGRCSCSGDEKLGCGSGCSCSMEVARSGYALTRTGVDDWPPRDGRTAYQSSSHQRASIVNGGSGSLAPQDSSAVGMQTAALRVRLPTEAWPSPADSARVAQLPRHSTTSRQSHSRSSLGYSAEVPWDTARGFPWESPWYHAHTWLTCVAGDGPVCSPSADSKAPILVQSLNYGWSVLGQDSANSNAEANARQDLLDKVRDSRQVADHDCNSCRGWSGGPYTGYACTEAPCVKDVALNGVECAVFEVQGILLDAALGALGLPGWFADMAWVAGATCTTGFGATIRVDCTCPLADARPVGGNVH